VVLLPIQRPPCVAVRLVLALAPISVDAALRLTRVLLCVNASVNAVMTMPFVLRALCRNCPEVEMHHDPREVWMGSNGWCAGGVARPAPHWGYLGAGADAAIVPMGELGVYCGCLAIRPREHVAYRRLSS